jgi:hypothetical protein
MVSTDSQQDLQPARRTSGIGRADWTPRVSILMTIYNADPYLKEAIDSIVLQTFQDWELIAVENGSTDSSPAILASYDDPRIRTFALGKNIGRTSALRYAFDEARGEFIAVLDADDLAHTSRLERQVAYLDRHLALGLVGTWAEEIDLIGNVVGMHRPPAATADLRNLLGWSNPFVHSAIMYRSALAREVGGYPAHVTYSQDYSLILQIARRSEVGMIEGFFCKHRSSAGSMTNDPSLRLVRAEEELQQLREAAGILRLSPTAVRRNRHRQAVAKLKIGFALLGTSHFAAGVAHIMSVILTNPRALVDNGFVYRRFRPTR